MKPRDRLALLALAAGVASCVSGPQPVPYRAGSTLGERQAAVDACHIESLAKIPPQMETVVTPGHIGEPLVRCRPDGRGGEICHEAWLEFPATYRTRDVNAGLRDRYVAGCLSRRGYDLIARPVCSGSAARAVHAAQTDGQPGADAIACVDKSEVLDLGR